VSLGTFLRKLRINLGPLSRKDAEKLGGVDGKVADVIFRGGHAARLDCTKDRAFRNAALFRSFPQAQYCHCVVSLGTYQGRLRGNGYQGVKMVSALKGLCGQR
jgi:hypothetical protein